MKLLSMVEFSLQKSKECKEGKITPDQYIEQHVLYAEFLMQPLTLGMFVPVDENGDFLNKPIESNYIIDGFVTQNFFWESNDYQKALDNVLFEGFEYDNNTSKLKRKHLTVTKQMLNSGNYKVEFLIDFTLEFLDITLTPNAIKKLKTMSNYTHIEGKTPPKKVVAPEGCEDYLTPGKVYDVIKITSDGFNFFIKADNNHNTICLEKKCGHLNGKDWIVIERE